MNQLESLMQNISDHFDAIEFFLKRVVDRLENSERRIGRLELAAKTPQPTPGLAKSGDDPNEAQTRNDDEQQNAKNNNYVNFHISRGDDESYWQSYDFQE